MELTSGYSIASAVYSAEVPAVPVPILQLLRYVAAPKPPLEASFGRQ
jgi:hypothetical protein